LAVKNKENKPKLYLLLFSLIIRVPVDDFRMNILKCCPYGMMSDVVASGAVKVPGNHSAFVLYVIRFRT